MRRKKNLKKSIGSFFHQDFIKTIGLYTFGFLLTCSFILFIYAKYKKGFAWYMDGYVQHFVTLNYFRSTLLDFFKTGQINFFLWNLGTGFDMFGNLAYYIFGDFLSYFSVFVSQKYLYLYYYFLVFFRIYLIGISFLIYSKYKKMNRFSSLVGALMYSFCSFVLFAGVRHPYFSLAVALFPLLLLGIERYVSDGKWGFYVFLILFTAITNFYFAYSMFLILAIYGVILVIYTYHSFGFKHVFFRLLRLLGYSILGLLLSSFILVPTIYSFFHSARSGGMEIFSYAPYYFRNFLPSLITMENGYWRYFGVQSIILMTLPIFLRNRKKYYPFFLMFCLLFIPLLFSQVGSIFMGFSYPNSRWSYAVAFCFCFMTTLFLNEEHALKKEDFLWIGSFLFVYFFLIFVLKSTINRLFLFEFCLFFGYFLLFAFRGEFFKKFKSLHLFQGMIFLLLFGGLYYTCSFLYDVNGNNYSSQFVNFNRVNHMNSTNYEKTPDFTKALNFIKENDSSFYRISMDNNPHQNLALMKDYNSITYFYSIVPSEFRDMSLALENRDFSINKEYSTFDYRSRINSLLGNKYYIFSGNTKLPYGYEKMNYNGTSKIYKNKYTLPFGVLYTDYISVEDFAKLSPIEKENSLMKFAALTKEDIASFSGNFHSVSLPLVKNLAYQVKKNSILEDHRVEIKSTSNNKLELTIPDFENSELYVSLSNLRYTPYSKEEKIQFELKGIKDKESQKNDIAKIEYKYKDYLPTYNYRVNAKFDGRTVGEGTQNVKVDAYYFDNFDYVINLGYYEKNKKNVIELSFMNEGYYTFDDVSIVAVSMDDYPKEIENLRRSNYQVTEYGDGYMKGTVDAEENGILQFATTYSDGWNIYVDGEKVTSLVTNQYFLGAYLSKGSHEIELRYHTPWLKEGIVISIISGIVCLVLSILYKHKLRLL